MSEEKRKVVKEWKINMKIEKVGKGGRRERKRNKSKENKGQSEREESL